MEVSVVTAANWAGPTLPRALVVPTAPVCGGWAGFSNVDTCAHNTNTSAVSTADGLCLALLPAAPHTTPASRVAHVVPPLTHLEACRPRWKPGI